MSQNLHIFFSVPLPYKISGNTFENFGDLQKIIGSCEIDPEDNFTPIFVWRDLNGDDLDITVFNKSTIPMCSKYSFLLYYACYIFYDMIQNK